MRKNNGYEVLDNIRIFFHSDEEVIQAVQKHREYIMQETLAVSIESVSDEQMEKQNLNGHEAEFD